MCRVCVGLFFFHGDVFRRLSVTSPYEFMFLVGCLYVWMLMCVTGANSYVRSEVTPSHLGLGVCRGLHQLSKTVGWTPFTPSHKPHSPTPLDLIRFTANSRPQDKLGKRGVWLAHVGRMFFSNALKWTGCAFLAGVAVTALRFRNGSCCEKYIYRVVDWSDVK